MVDETNDVDDFDTTVTDDEVTLDDVPVFDTSKALRRKRVSIDGIMFTIRPVGTKDYYNILKRRNQIQTISEKLNGDPKALLQANKMLDDVVIPLISPAEDFKSWARDTREKSEYVYRQVMDRLIALALQGVEVSNG